MNDLRLMTPSKRGEIFHSIRQELDICIREVDKNYLKIGLLWVDPENWKKSSWGNRSLIWKKKPMNFQRRDSLAWFWTYTHVLETEIIRLDIEAARLRSEMAYRDKRANEA